MVGIISRTIRKLKFGIKTYNQKMKNGEVRFYLNQKGKYGYIMTISKDEGVWQKPHYHKYFGETYIIQSGKVIYAFNKENKWYEEIINENGIFTTEPNVPHNIYTFPDTIMHTVKHGDVSMSDWHEDTSITFEEFKTELESKYNLKQNKDKKKDELKRTSLRNYFSVFNHYTKENPPSYSTEYKHFDNLIWQVPAWATAIFTLAISFIGSITVKNMNWPNENGISMLLAIGILYIILGLILQIFGYALFRFRIHQNLSRKEQGLPWPFSAHSWLQLAVTIESAILFFIGILFLNLRSGNSYSLKMLVLVFSVAIVINLIYGYFLGKKNRNGAKIS